MSINLAKNQKSGFIAKTLSGLESSLARELIELGASEVDESHRAVFFSGDKKLLYRVNLESRLATRILLPIKRFNASNGDQLYRKVSEIDWTKLIKADQTLMVDSVVSNSDFNNSLFVAQKVKDAIVDQIRKKSGRRPSVDLVDPDLRINIHINQNNVTLSLDSSGAPLQKRGYRKSGGEAPLNEVLASGIINLTGWNGQSPLIDFMCGSGTFLIEAALLAKKIAPGLHRKSFAFFKWSDFDRSLWEKVISEAEAKIIDKFETRLIGADISTKRINEAISNAKRAGVADLIEFRQGDFKDFEVPQTDPGTVILNPPYGERLKADDLNIMYGEIGDCLKQKFSGFDAYIFTGNSGAANKIGHRTSRKIPLYNGPIECRLLKFELYLGSRKKV